MAPYYHHNSNMCQLLAVRMLFCLTTGSKALLQDVTVSCFVEFVIITKVLTFDRVAVYSLMRMFMCLDLYLAQTVGWEQASAP